MDPTLANNISEDPILQYRIYQTEKWGIARRKDRGNPAATTEHPKIQPESSGK